MRVRWRFRLQRTFFGLSDEYLEKGVYEELHILMYHGTWSFTEAYSLPVGLRKWFLQRLVEQKKQEHEEAKRAQNKK